MFTYVYGIVIIEVTEINSNFSELFIIDVTNRYINIYRRYIMLNILMINVPYSGHTNPTLLLAEVLVKRGHNVVYVNSNEFKDKIEATGAKFIPYINFSDNLSFQQKKMRCFKAAFDTAMSLHQEFDLLIYEMFFYPGKKVAENLDIPCVRQFSQPAWNNEMARDVSPIFSLSCKLIDIQMVGKKKAKQMGLGNNTMIKAILNDKPDLNIVYVPEFFQAHRDTFGENYIFTKPPLKPMKSSIIIPYSEMKAPIIYISLGSILQIKSFYKKCIKAFGNKNVSVIMNIGKVNPAELGKIPDNIYIYSFVPQIDVLQHTDLFITSCGMNSVNEAMTFGVPMLGLPLVNDQLANAKRISELGNGRKLNIMTLTAKKLHSASMSVLNNQIINAKAQWLKEELNRNSNFSTVVNKVEEIAKITN